MRGRWIGTGLVLASFLWCGLAGAAEPASGGTPQLVHDFFPGEFEPDESLGQLTPLGSTAFFVAQDLDAAPKVWRTDGTPAGTRRAAITGVSGSEGDRQGIVGRVGRYMLWTSNELLVSSAEEGDGVVLHTHVRRGEPAILGNRYFFYGCGTPDRCTVWSTDGTVSGTKPVQALAGRFPTASPQIIGTHAGRWLLLGAEGALFAYDVRNDQVLLLFPEGARNAERIPAGETLFFRTRRQLGNETRMTLWASRLDAPRASRIFEDPEIEIAGVRGSLLYFTNEKGRLWSTDGRPGSARPYDGRRLPSYSFSDLADQLGTINSTTLIPVPGYYVGALLAIDETRGEMNVVKTFCSGKYDCLSFHMSALTMAGGKAFVSINNKLWQSDGTREGTKAHEILSKVNVSTFRVLDDRLLLGATSRQGEEQLWETDGTASGTRALSDGTPDRPFRVLGAPVPLGNKLLVVAERIPVGQQLWSVSDGHATPLTTVRHLAAGVFPSFAYPLGERILFTGSGGWFGLAEDGLVEPLPIAPPHCENLFGPCPLRPAEVGQRLLFPFSTPDGSPPYFGLVFSDGTAAGSGVIPLQTPEGALTSPIIALGRLGDQALILSQGGGVWVSDGSAPETRFITSLPVDSADSSRIEAVESPIPLGSQTLFFRYVPVSPDLQRANLEVWRTDGTMEGTLLLAAIPSTRGFAPESLNPAVLKDRLFFGFGGKVWVSDGSAAGTYPLPSQPGYTFGLAGGTETLYAATFGNDNEPQTLWGIDPTTLAATQLGSFNSIQIHVGGVLGYVLGDTLFFLTADEQWVYEWWVTEGTPSSTRPVPDRRVSTRGQDFVTAGDRRYFVLCDKAHGCELWSTDRLGEDTRLAVDLWPGPQGSHPRILAVSGDALWFSATEPSVGNEIWKIDLSRP
jgi:ELWxxDGT repeat protein